MRMGLEQNKKGEAARKKRVDVECMVILDSILKR
jgi:hypothetical protein